MYAEDVLNEHDAEECVCVCVCVCVCSTLARVYCVHSMAPIQQQHLHSFQGKKLKGGDQGKETRPGATQHLVLNAGRLKRERGGLGAEIHCEV